MNEPNLDPNTLPNGLFSKTFWILASIFVVGALGRLLLTDEKIPLRRAIGEVSFAVIGAIAMNAFGVMQGLSVAEVYFYGCLASLGSVRFLQIIIQAVQAAASKGG